MRKIAIVILGILVVGLLASADEPMVTWKAKDLELTQTARVGTTVLPAGKYRVTHEMEGSTHIMVFKLESKAKTSFRVPCTLQPLAAKARGDEQHFRTEGKEHVLIALVFAGDRVKHSF
ncbi:MAG: hypothetical protein HYX28_01235 [Candidatus Koribacter versatilis]|uniref:Uncharacterized protein n=1 Tax=Candidatus Korobacter versatilis TaxID=658062 RepID=A0A932ENJ4_9BACT|nr:hypothetical protein [Candidatus Koribacter versatilis]